MFVRLLHPRWWGVHLLAVVLVAAAAWLGSWQYDAWQTRRVAEAIDLTQAAPEPLAEALGPGDGFPGDKLGQPVEVRGVWQPADTVYVTGRTGGDDEREGVWVVTPMLVDGQNASLLVVRGWAENQTLAPSTPEEEARVIGWLQPSDGSGATDPDPADDLLPALRVGEVLQRVDGDLYSAYAVVTGDTVEAGLQPATLEQLPPAGRFTALRNFLYALEWWVFGLFAAFIWWRFVRDGVEAERAVEAVAAAGSANGPPEDAVLSET